MPDHAVAAFSSCTPPATGATRSKKIRVMRSQDSSSLHWPCFGKAAPGVLCRKQTTVQATAAGPARRQFGPTTQEDSGLYLTAEIRLARTLAINLTDTVDIRVTRSSAAWQVVKYWDSRIRDVIRAHGRGTISSLIPSFSTRSRNRTQSLSDQFWSKMR